VSRTVVVLGGTGFLGRRVARRLSARSCSVRVASRHPERAHELFHGLSPEPQGAAVDIHDAASVARSVAGAQAVVNAVSLYVEHGSETFRSLHVTAAGRVAQLAREAGVDRLVHVSGIGADAASPSLYIRSRGQGDEAVRSAFPAATLIRPCVMFGPDDAFLTTILSLLRRLPVYPMFGHGATRLQPVHVEDVAEAIARVVERDDSHAATFECGGPRVFSYAELIETVAHAARLQVSRIPVPFAAWHALARLAEVLPGHPLTRNQVELMQIDTVVSPHAHTLADLGIQPRDLERAVEAIAFPEIAA
jgi:NADH dehydrogenase